MNQYEVLLLLDAFIHVIIWVIVIIGGAWYRPLVKWNLLFILPFVFLVQSILPIHILVSSKLLLIHNHPHAFKPPGEPCHFTPQVQEELRKFAKIHNTSVNQMKYYFAIMTEYENYLILPYIKNKLQEKFQNAFRNPFDAHGMIIIAFIVNLYLLYFKYNGRL